MDRYLAMDVACDYLKGLAQRSDLRSGRRIAWLALVYALGGEQCFSPSHEKCMHELDDIRSMR